jgi:major membrane immunogen (membrane-anchored lipoprotein)
MTVSLILVLALATGAFAHGDATHVMGTITAFEKDHMTVKQTDGKLVTVMVDSKTKYTREKGTASKADLKAGVRVMVEAKEDKAMKMLLAEQVQVGAAETMPAAKK